MGQTGRTGPPWPELLGHTAGDPTINTDCNIVTFTGSPRGGFALYDGLAGDDNFIMQADVGLAGGTDATVLSRFLGSGQLVRGP